MSTGNEKLLKIEFSRSNILNTIINIFIENILLKTSFKNSFFLEKRNILLESWMDWKKLLAG